MASIANVVGINANRISVVPTAGAVIGSGNMTAANPIVVTVSGHGLVTGDYVSFSAISQANWVTALNNKSFQIIKLSDNTFSIPVNGTTFGAYTDASGKVWHDFYSGKYFPLKLRIAGIDFFGSNANDILYVRDGSYTGPILFHKKDVTPAGVERLESPSVYRARPYVRFSEATLGGTVNTASVVIEFN